VLHESRGLSLSTVGRGLLDFVSREVKDERRFHFVGRAPSCAEELVFTSDQVLYDASAILESLVNDRGCMCLATVMDLRAVGVTDEGLGRRFQGLVHCQVLSCRLGAWFNIKITPNAFGVNSY